MLLWQWHQEAHLAKAGLAWLAYCQARVLSGWRVVAARCVKLARLLDMVLSRKNRNTMRAVFEVLHNSNATRLAQSQRIRLEEVQVGGAWGMLVHGISSSMELWLV